MSKILYGVRAVQSGLKYFCAVSTRPVLTKYEDLLFDLKSQRVGNRVLGCVGRIGNRLNGKYVNINTYCRLGTIRVSHSLGGTSDEVAHFTGGTGAWEYIISCIEDVS